MKSEIPPNNFYISVSRQNVCPKHMAIVMTLVSKTTFLNPLRGGNFSNLIRYGDIPSSHCDIPMVSIQIHEVESIKQQKSVLSKFQPHGVYVRVLLVLGTQVSRLVCSFNSDSPSLHKNIFLGHLSIFDYLFLAAFSLDSLFQSTPTSLGHEILSLVSPRNCVQRHRFQQHQNGSKPNVHLSEQRLGRQETLNCLTEGFLFV